MLRLISQFAILAAILIVATFARGDEIIPVDELPSIPSAQTYPSNVVRVWRGGKLIYQRDGTKAPKSRQTASTLLPGEINRDSRAYAWAKREATMLANGMWNNSRRTGHPLGTAPGCSFSGTGISSGRPNHCYRNLGDGRIVARACVYRNGRYYWSAHLR